MRGVFLRRAGGLELGGRVVDARMARIAADAAVETAGNLAATSSATSRVRFVLEGSRSFDLGAGRLLTPTVEFGVRRDGGDVETGAVVVLGGSPGYADAARGLSVVVRGRTLIAYGDAAYREWGAGATVRLDSGTAGRGLNLSLSPEWGAAGAGSAERLWSIWDAVSSCTAMCSGLRSSGLGARDHRRFWLT